ncbi:MAG TPA: hypothetical protein VHR66_03085 [Gemmataceae bacterium]|jgi:hypothetical protein|nr:hypothetical protein [Gemmataceae bacterium]
MYRPVSPLVFVLMTGCLMALALLVAALARQGRPRPLPGRGDLLFRHNSLFRWVTLLAALGLPMGLTALLFLYPPQKSEIPYFVCIYLVFALVTLPFVWEAGRYYLLVTANGLECRSPWRGSRTIAWTDLQSMSFSLVNAWFEFESEDGDRIRVHSFVAGLNNLLAAVEAQIPARSLKSARSGYARVGRPFPPLVEEPVLEALRPRRPGEW